MDPISNTHVVHCEACGEPIGKNRVSCGEQVVLVKCRTCDRRYYLADNADLSHDLTTGHQAIHGFFPSRHLTAQRSGRIKSLIKKYTATYQEEEHRFHTRLQVPIPLTVVPLESHFQPISAAYEATSIDLSSHGISFTVASDCGACYWLVDFGSQMGPGLQIVMKMIRMEPAGEGCWKVAGPFATPMDKVPT